jgi:FxsC-like protein
MCVTLVCHPEERMRYFFLSYARGDDAEYVRRFYELLSREVRIRAGLNSDVEVGFLDRRGIDVGQVWSEELAEALGNCRTFIALCSPSYFNRDYCGREWAAFSSRVEQFDSLGNERPPVMLPLMWVRSTELDPVVAKIQYAADDVGMQPTPDGLLNCMRLSAHRARRLLFAEALAEKIVTVARRYHLPPMTRVRIENYQNPFQNRPIEAASVARLRKGEVEVRETARLVHFAVVAGSQDEMRQFRRHLEYYGETYDEWTPYHADFAQPIATYAAEIAREREFRSSVLDISGLEARMSDIKRHNQLIVLLVDAWSTKVEVKRTALHRFDEMGEPRAAVMIPFNSTDDETEQHWLELEEEIRRVLWRNWRRGVDYMFTLGMPRHGDFRDRLEVVLAIAQNRAFRNGRAPRVPPGSGDSPPTLSVPST